MTQIIDKIYIEVCNIAKQTGSFLKEEQSKLSRSNVELKGTRNFVTYIDKEAEIQIVKCLTPLIPEAGFLTEEDTIENESKEFTWIIDPLDGTTNYIHGDNPYGVSIALMKENKIVLGVVYDPLTKELFSAFDGENGEARLNGQIISVSSHKTLKNAYLSFGIPYQIDVKAEEIFQNAYKLFRSSSFRIKGSAALEICYVACGRFDGYFHSGLSPWDVAASSYILQRAGGICTDYCGLDNYIFGKEMVASNPSIYSEIMQQIIK
ncbi:MAG: inositol monophosphatase family protein [Dysgonamonadaceae bacterium]|jgi:myo-inositol-1(or 4)-monophosphatase|nr:inositol monophosphatase family protein [Dysgonamonadaceae bacterium]MDD3308662.1 inositol monophosphatase family protein [Dysgonamonadaceae bacterium]MDD3899746.1 inositol monophosphatase family protein [Dysgonamonadaceae bacterium]MDD4397975.1 inositol monophosphatase family protein [Dysgonamonadaceae bacterium]